MSAVSAPLPRTTGAAAYLRLKAFPVATVILAIFAIWYVGAVALNAPFQRQLFATANQTYTTGDLIAATLEQERPVLPSPIR